MKYHVNGELVPESEATVSVRDRGFLYGDAAFETLRAYGSEPFEWNEHADRLEETSRLLGIDHGISRHDLRARIDDTLAANDLTDAYIRLSVSRGVQPGKLTPAPTEEPTVVVIVKELPRGGIAGESVWDSPATVTVADTQRIPNAAIPARAKTHNYINGILARLECQRTGARGGGHADEALLLDADGTLTEGATSNLFFVRDGVLKTPSLDGPVLPGITRAVVLDLADELGIPVETGNYMIDELLEANEAFLTNSTWELRPIERVDGEEIGDGVIRRRLQSAFDERVEDYYESS